MISKRMEMKIVDGKMQFVEIEEGKFDDLKRGQIVHWGGNMGAPECDKVIIRKEKGWEDRIQYKVISIPKDYELESKEYEPCICTLSADDIKDPTDKSLWHTQHNYITDKTYPEEKIVELEEWADRVKTQNEKEQEENSRVANINKAKRNPDKRLVVLKLCYNNSNSMVDYFDPARSIKTWVLAEIPKGKRLISILKKIVAKYPTLKDMDWTEHRETHSFNSFGYSLTSGSVKISDYTDKKAEVYMGNEVEYGFFMVEFGYFDNDAGADDWIEKPIEPTKSNNKKLEVTEITFKKNEEKNGLEIYFPNKPSEDVRNILKNNGFRWGKYNKCWYKRYSEGLEEQMKKQMGMM